VGTGRTETSILFPPDYMRRRVDPARLARETGEDGDLTGPSESKASLRNAASSACRVSLEWTSGSGAFEYCFMVQCIELGGLGGLKIDGGFAAKGGGDNQSVEVVVSLELDTHEPCVICSRARCSRRNASGFRWRNDGTSCLTCSSPSRMLASTCSW
jgi:hypothetical protein